MYFYESAFGAFLRFAIVLSAQVGNDLQINRINSQVRGLIQYYQCCSWANISMKKYSRRLQLVAKTRLKQYNGKWIPANKTQNLSRLHQKYKQKIAGWSKY